MATKDETLELIQWAKHLSSTDDMISKFWGELCKAVRESPNSSATKIYSELRLYGGNTIANIFRDGKGVAYTEVAYEVAEALRPMSERRTYIKGDLLSCERDVLTKMEVKTEDIEKMARLINVEGENNVVQEQAKETLKKGVAYLAGQQVAKFVATAAAERALAETGKTVAKKAAQKAAQEVAKQTLARVVSSVNIFLAAWTVISFAGPARRVTIPAVTYIALLRQIYQLSQSSL